MLSRDENQCGHQLQKIRKRNGVENTWRHLKGDPIKMEAALDKKSAKQKVNCLEEEEMVKLSTQAVFWSVEHQMGTNRDEDLWPPNSPQTMGGEFEF